MSYMLRDRPDGQVEIVLMKPTLIGVFPERDVAQRLFYLLQAEEPELPVDEPASFGRASADVAEAENEEVEEMVPRVSAPRRNLPVPVVEKPRAPMIRVEVAPQLSSEQIDTAFARITAGEKISSVAKDYGLTMYQLRGMWAHSKRGLQKHMASGGKETCKLCARPFTPSLTSPDTCSRCSHD